MTGVLRTGGIAGVLAAAAAVVPLSGAAAAEPRKPEPAVPLVSVLSDSDYPAEAIRAGEQGMVVFRLAVGADGRVSGCEVMASSGSESLDSTTCRLMTTRVGFRPATDSAGKAVAGSYEGRIAWRLPAGPRGRIDLPDRPGAAIGLWSACADGEAAKLALSALGTAEIAGRAFAACAALEERIAREIAEAKVEGLDVDRIRQALRDDFTANLRPRLEQTRSLFQPRPR